MRLMICLLYTQIAKNASPKGTPVLGSLRGEVLRKEWELPAYATTTWSHSGVDSRTQSSAKSSASLSVGNGYVTFSNPP